uniref:BED-type domain-containing protein n=1 Tax=Phaseolus vulgaris TaxID=3885 RepID=V7CQX1_PHAVU|nr:hypothetical protein PHAVU_002G255200g [Phaseolus vulgaris]XP_007159646.1 hypothetical protein PHAVU_002G255200g [Phaseolus vulgaris]ESW31639.1 hypothetical protein PHAVU_002G255200g [Phaseolus vulgaris]ESW31640.1 hypothetical protein PHAVU_002G255200g [Phaseolus vulgaris]
MQFVTIHSPRLVPITSQKHDPIWKHVQMFKNSDKVQLKCIYFLKMFEGGGIRRIKEHLACQKGNASICSRLPHDVKLNMQQSLDGAVVKKMRKQKIEEIISVNPLGIAVNLLPNNNQVDVNQGLQAIGVDHNSSLVVNPSEGMSKNMERRKKTRASKNLATIYANSEGVVVV